MSFLLVWIEEFEALSALEIPLFAHLEAAMNAELKRRIENQLDVCPLGHRRYFEEALSGDRVFSSDDVLVFVPEGQIPIRIIAGRLTSLGVRRFVYMHNLIIMNSALVLQDICPDAVKTQEDDFHPEVTKLIGESPVGTLMATGPHPQIRFEAQKAI